MSSLQKSILKAKLPPIPVTRKLARKPKDYSPVSWNTYFQEKRDVCLPNSDVFRVYSTGKAKEYSSVLCLLHGGGFSALTWSLFTTSVTSMVHCEVVAMDLRGHGGTKTSDDSDLSAAVMANDVARVMSSLYPSADVPILLIGHSMGGAIAVHVADMGLIPNLAAVVVIDVVEGTAMDALTSMQSFLRGRPSQFKSLDQAIEWCVRSGQVRNLESAKVSMPGQLKNAVTGSEAIDDIGKEFSPTGESKPVQKSADCIQEEDEAMCDAAGQSESPQPMNLEAGAGSAGDSVTSVFKNPQVFLNKRLGQAGEPYTWRIDLAKTEIYWPGWFTGLSKKFMNLACYKMLLLAGIDRLDKELTVGQMQGKFQMQVLPHCGHTVHEDIPDQVAQIVATFLVRHHLAEAAGSFERSFPAC